MDLSADRKEPFVAIRRDIIEMTQDANIAALLTTVSEDLSLLAGIDPSGLPLIKDPTGKLCDRFGFSLERAETILQQAIDSEWLAKRSDCYSYGPKLSSRISSCEQDLIQAFQEDKDAGSQPDADIEDSDQPIDPDEIIRIYRNWRGTRATSKQLAKLRQFIETLDCSHSQLMDALYSFLNDEENRSHHYNVDRLVSHLTSSLCRRVNFSLSLTTPARPSPFRSAKQFDLAKRVAQLKSTWESAPGLPPINAWHDRYDRALVENALSDPELELNWPKIVTKAAAIHQAAGERASWLTFRWLLRYKDGRPNWHRLLAGELDWLKRAQASQASDLIKKLTEEIENGQNR